MSTFDESARPRGHAGKFTTKDPGLRRHRLRVQFAREQQARREVPGRLRAVMVGTALRKAGVNTLPAGHPGNGLIVREDVVDKTFVRVFSTSDSIGPEQVDRAECVLSADDRFEITRTDADVLLVSLKKERS